MFVNDGRLMTNDVAQSGQKQSVTNQATPMAIEEHGTIDDQATRSQRMEALGQLAGGIAHDFNNLLTIIKGYTQLMLTETSDGDPRQEDLEEILEAANRAAALTHQLLLFGRRQRAQREVFPLNTLIGSLEKMLRRLISEDIQFAVELSTADTRIVADRNQLEQVLMNLIINAQDATPHGGKVLVSTQSEGQLQPPLKSGLKGTPGHYISVTVTDTGTGIPTSNINKIFEPFYSTKRPGQGTGLGLAVVYGIIKQHAGWIDIDSTENKGTSVKVFLPAASDEEVAKQPIEPDEMNLDGLGEKLLVIEDEEGVRKVCSRTLRSSGYLVVEAATGAEAHTEFDKDPDSFDLIFSDMVLPDAFGLQLAREFKSQRPKLPILLTSGYTDEKAHREAVKDGGFMMLHKPYELHDLLRRIKMLLVNKSI